MKKRGRFKHRNSQVISMDLILGFLMFIVAISFFFYAIGEIPIFKQKKTLNVQADFVFTSIETIPSTRINFLKEYKVSENKLILFSELPYESFDKDSDGLGDTWEDSKLCPIDSANPNDCDNDLRSNIEELKKGTDPKNGDIYPQDSEEDGGEVVGDALDDWWEMENGIENTGSSLAGMIFSSFDGVYEDLDEDAIGPERGLTAVFNQENHDWYDFTLPCGFDTKFTDEFYEEDTIPNRVLDGSDDATKTGVLLDGETESKCNFLGYNNDFSFNPTYEGIYPNGRLCVKCMPNYLRYNRDVRKGDFDHDGLNDVNEANLYFGMDPFVKDLYPTNHGNYPVGVKFSLLAANIDPGTFSDDDSDMLPDAWEKYFGLDITDECGSAPSLSAYNYSCTYGDPDNDWVSNWDELIYGTDPLNPDTNGDGTTDFYDDIRPLRTDIISIVLGDINEFDFTKIDVCIYFEKSDGEILHHVGGGDSSDNMISMGTGIRCGGNPQNIPSIDDPRPECKTSPYIETIIMSKPVMFVYSDGKGELLNMRVLVCARQ
ncbi:MAG: hypothetical protein KKF44_03540 [Nanoarchaeota archaeon]|nr:hypothetical protein [Nanoarchaeota archaeon]